MAFTRAHWIRHRPFLYHFAPVANVELIANCGKMLSAEVIVRRAHAYDATQISNPDAFLSLPRESPAKLLVGPAPEDVFVLNDQLPMLHESSFAGLVGTRAEYISLLNSFVFYWPGNESGPVTKSDHGQKFRQRYNEFAELRIPVADLWSEITSPKFCRYNSGAPQPRDGVTRGAGVFVSAQDDSLVLKKVVEIVFSNQVALPRTAEWRRDASSDWQPINVLAR